MLRLNGCVFVLFALAAMPAAAMQVPAGTVAAKVTVHDLRTPAQRSAYRAPDFSALYYLADSAVDPRPVAMLRQALRRHMASPEALDVRLHTLRIIDYFPQRLGSRPGALAPGSITRHLMDRRTDWSFVDRMHLPEHHNTVICLVSATVNGRMVETAAFRPYRLQGFSFRVHSNKGFRRSVRQCIDAMAARMLAPQAPAGS